ncbi:unnamed protein product [Tuber aestivum]|uniref:Uncharacterized protein n=1 Tax=Tuber aestivum TaxID=59557 RepID=A0A292Q577_9PEZI|nr:unnamed protein product [Tuber aestivum]
MGPLCFFSEYIASFTARQFHPAHSIQHGTASRACFTVLPTMSPFAFIIAIVAIARFATAYPHGASSAVQLPSPTRNPEKQSASASATPTPNEASLPDSANPIQGLRPALDDAPRDSPVPTRDQGSGSGNIVPTVRDVYDSFSGTWSSGLFKYTIYWLFFLLAILLNLVAVRCSSREIIEIKACWSRKKRNKECPEETQPENPEGAQLVKNSLRETQRVGGEPLAELDAPSAYYCTPPTRLPLATIAKYR